MPQLTYGLDRQVTVAGSVQSGTAAKYDSGMTAGEVIPPGRLCGVDPATVDDTVPKVRLFQAGDKFAGVSVYRAAREKAAYQINEPVDLLRAGEVYVEFTGSAPSKFDAVNISASTTTATTRGMGTKAATSGVGGSEISAVAPVVALCTRPGVVADVSSSGATNVARISLNLP